MVICVSLTLWFYYGNIVGSLSAAVVLLLDLMVPLTQILGRRFDVVGPSIWYLPAVAITLLFAVWYPNRYTGELTELAMGYAFAFIALDESWKNGVRFQKWDRSEAGVKKAPLAHILPVFGLTILIGIVGVYLSRVARSAYEVLIKTAEQEVTEITRDFVRLYRNNQHKFVIRCRLHQRLYSYIDAYGTAPLQ